MLHIDGNTEGITYTPGPGSGLVATLIGAQDWSLAFWLYNTSASNRNIWQSYQATGTLDQLRLTTTGSGQNLKAEIFDALGVSIAQITVNGVWPDPGGAPGWALCILTNNYDGAANATLELRCIRSDGTQLATGSSSAYVAASTGVLDRLRIGAALTNAPTSAALGHYGPFVLRRSLTSDAEAAAVFALKSPGMLLQYSDGTNWTNSNQAYFAWNHFSASHNSDQDGGSATAGLPSDWSPASNALPSNIALLDRGVTNAIWGVYGTDLAISAGAFAHKDANNAVAGYFTLGTPSGGTAVNFANVAGVNPALRRLADNTPFGIDRILFLSNSRGSRISYDARTTGGNWPQHYGGGVILQRLANCVGAICQQPAGGTGSAQFGLDQSAAACASGGALTAESAKSENWTRVGYGSNATDSLGPGYTLEIDPAGYKQYLWSDVTGSKFLKTNARRFRGLFLAYPGSANVTGERYTGATIDAAGTDRAGTDHAVTLETQTGSVTADLVGLNMGGTPYVEFNKADVVGAAPAVGQGILASATASAGSAKSISVVMTVTDTGTTYVVELDKAFTGGFASTWNLYWGPLSFRWCAVDYAASEFADAFQGVRFTPTGGGGFAPLLVTIEAYATDVSGWGIGSTGWGGNGYSKHLSESFNQTPLSAGSDQAGMTLYQAFLLALGLDALVIIPAQQDSTPSDMGTVADTYRDSGATGRVAFVADPAHGRNDNITSGNSWGVQDYSAWVAWIEANASAYGAVGIGSAWASLGVFADQPPRGWRADGVSHLTSEGNKVWAASVLSALATASLSTTGTSARGRARARGRSTGIMGA